MGGIAGDCICRMETEMILPNRPGDYQVEGIRVRITATQVMIDTSAIVPYEQPSEFNTPQRLPVNRDRHIWPMRELKEDAPIDRVGKSAVKTVKYMNDFLWGEK